jgi:hypothetical protein
MTEWSRVHVTSNRPEVDITRALLANTSSHPAGAMAFVGHVDLDGASRLAVGLIVRTVSISGSTSMWAQITVAPCPDECGREAPICHEREAVSVERIRHRSTPVIARAGACLPAMATSP